jgi:hypothetical protein
MHVSQATRTYVEHVKKYRNSICQHRIDKLPHPRAAPQPPNYSPHDLKYVSRFAKSNCCHGCGSYKVCTTLKPSALLTLTHYIISGVSRPNCWPTRVIVTLLSFILFSEAETSKQNQSEYFEFNHVIRSS